MMKEMQLDEMMLVNGGASQIVRDGEVYTGSQGGSKDDLVEKVVSQSGGSNTARVLGTDMRGGGGMPRTALDYN